MGNPINFAREGEGIIKQTVTLKKKKKKKKRSVLGSRELISCKFLLHIWSRFKISVLG